MDIKLADGTIADYYPSADEAQKKSLNTSWNASGLVHVILGMVYTASERGLTALPESQHTASPAVLKEAIRILDELGYELGASSNGNEHALWVSW